MGYLALLEFECLVLEVTSYRVVWCRLPGLMPGQRGLKTGKRNVKTQAERSEWLWTWRDRTASEVMSLLNFRQGKARIVNGEFLRIFPLKEMETHEGLGRRCENQTGEVCACHCHPKDREFTHPSIASWSSYKQYRRSTHGLRHKSVSNADDAWLLRSSATLFQYALLCDMPRQLTQETSNKSLERDTWFSIYWALGAHGEVLFFCKGKKPPNSAGMTLFHSLSLPEKIV